MKTPILIPAFNEAFLIANTLSHLPAETTEPIVIVNGSNDETAEVAQRYTSNVHVLEKQGKMPAIQYALRHLGSRALEPLLVLDADTRPLFPNHWHAHFMNLLGQFDTPMAVGGPIIYKSDQKIEASLRTVWRALRAARQPYPNELITPTQYGPNMGLKINDADTLDEIMAFPNYWPSEDRAIAQAIIEHGGVFRQDINIRGITLTPTSVSATPLKNYLTDGASLSRDKTVSRYIDRGGPSTIPFTPSV